MSHDKIKAAVRRRMAQTGESYSTARRKVLDGSQGSGAGARVTGPVAGGDAVRFAIRYDGMDAMSKWADTLLGGGPDGGRVEVDAEELRVRMADFKVDVPRGSVRRVERSSHRTRGTIGVHSRSGRWLVNGSAKGLVEITLDPPGHTVRCLSSMFFRREVNALIVSLVDPEGFIDVVRKGAGTLP